jgi:hypothetical protein
MTPTHGAPAHAHPPAGGERAGDSWDDAQRTTSAAAARLLIQRLGPVAGNRAVAGMLSAAPARRAPDPMGLAGLLPARSPRREPRREPGWAGATGWNAGAREESGVHRVPVDGITLGDQADFSGGHGGADGRATTSESAAGRAVVLVPKGLSDKASIAVWLHLHGSTGRSGDADAGWRERQDGTVRDVALDRLEAQLDAAGDPQVVGILPQGVGHSGLGRPDPGAYVDEVLGRLLAVGGSAGIPLPDPARGFELILSAHGGGGHTVRSVLDAERTAGGIASGEVVLIDAINDGAEATAVTEWATGHLSRTLAAVAQAGDPAGKDAAIAACPVLRAYHGVSRRYVGTYGDLRTAVDGWFADAAHRRELGPRLAALRDRFRVELLPGTPHERTVRGIGDDPAGGPMADALAAFRDPGRPSRLVTAQPRKPEPAPN